MRRKAARDVWVRAVGSDAAQAPPRAGPPGDQAALLRADRPGAAVRVGDQGDPGGGYAAALLERGRPAGVPRDPLRLGRGNLLPRRAQAPARPDPLLVARRGPAAAPLLAAARGSREVPDEPSGARLRAPWPPRRGRPESPHERRASRSLPLRRRRFERASGADGARAGEAGPALFRRLLRARGGPGRP